MSAIKGHASQGRISHNGSDENFVSVVKTDPKNRAGSDVLPKALYPVSALVKVALAVDPVLFPTTKNPTLRIVRLAGADTIIQKGDVLRFDPATTNSNMEMSVEFALGDYIYLSGELLVDPVGQDFLHMRHITLTISEDGELVTSSGPIQFVRDAVAQQVIEDTVTPANNVPLPVKLMSVTGDINITANDLNVQTSHLGANFDSQRIGDGTNIMAVNASLEALIHDTDVLARLVLIDAKLPAALGQLANAASLAVTLSTEQEALLAALKKELTVVDQLDAGVILASTINGSAGAFLQLVAASAAIIRKVQIVEDIGHFMALYTGAAAAEVFLCNLPLGGGEVEVNIPAATRITIRSTIAAAPTVGNMAMNLLG